MISFIVFILLILQSPAVHTASKDNNFPSTELKALQDLYYNTKGQYWTWKQNGKKWNFTEVNPNPCYEQWEGIECTSNCLESSLCNVKNISLSDYNLTGVLSSTIGNFHELQWLNLRSNVINCPIPNEIGNLTKLISLDLSHNYFSRALSAFTAEQVNLEVLSLSKNILSGNIPSSIGNLTNLRILKLNANFFKGQVPPGIGNLHKLTILDLAFNQLTGIVPESLIRLKQLEVLNFTENGFHNQIPSEFGQLISLTHLSLAGNGYFGTVPRSIYHLPKLQWLDLEGIPHLTDCIPSDIGNLTELRVLMMGRNSFTGTIPDNLCALSSLEVLVLDMNLFIGHFPPNIINLTKLRILDVEYNSFSGPIPPTLFAHLTELQMLSLNYNSFEGKLPYNMHRSTHLGVFSAGYNEFSGYLPESLAFCENLTYLNLRKNYFVGSIPAEYGSLFNLMAWYLFDNLMTGTIPSNLTSLTNLVDLELGYNALSGTIPEALGDLHRLLNLGLNNNFFHGSLPQSFGNMNNLLAATFQNNRFTGILPPVIARNWSKLEAFLLQNNLFSGRIDVIVNMHNLTSLNVSTNRFSGSFSNMNLDFPSLYSFDVSSNKFTGSLNHVFDQMPNLINMNVAHNHFTGNLNDVFVPKYLILVDISDNILSGTLPADVFRITNFQAFAAVKNCLTGTLPTDVICNSKSLYTLALDGLHTAEHCQNRFFPDIPFISSYHLAGTSIGSLPNCLFNMTTLQTLHLSGNGFTGSIPSNVKINGSLSDVSLSYNQLTGSIPDWIQNKVWKNLDVSFNKLDGELKNTFAAQDNSSTLNMIVNRLSGNIPTSLLTSEHVDMLQGNMFRCDASEMLGDVSRSLPNADAESATYDCGSDSVNTAMYIWLIVTGSFLIGIIAVVAASKNFFTNDRATMSEVQKLAVNIQTQLRSWQSNIKMALSIYKNNEHIISSNGDEISSRQAQEEKDLNPMYLLGESLTMIRTMAWRMAAFALFILLPVYCILASSFSTHSHVYIWTVALAYLSGWVPAIVVFVIMVFFYTLLGSRLRHDSFYHQHHDNQISVSFDRLYSYVAFHRFTRGDMKKICAYIAIILFNVIAVLAVNIAYVYTTTLNLNQSAIFFVEITISLFKITWSSFVVSYVFSRMLKSLTQDLATDDEQIKTATHRMIERLKFLSQLTIFNNIIAPFLADAFVDPDCFRYVINSQSSVTASYDTEICDTYGFSIGQGHTIRVTCHYSIRTSISTTYNPPFVYSYQCSSALLNGFVNVFIYRYLLTGVLLPLVRMLLLYLDDQYGILDILYRSFGKAMKMFEVQNSRRQKADAVEEDRHEREIQLQTSVNNPVLSTLNPILIEEQQQEQQQQPNAIIEKEDTKLQEGKTIISVQSVSEKLSLFSKLISQRIYNKEAIIVAIIGDFAVLLTFGLTFPPLAIMIAISIASNTYYHQLTLSRMLIMLQTIIVKPVTTGVSFLYNEMNQINWRWWHISKATIQLLTPLEAESIRKQLIANCGGDLMQLFWPMIPSLAILSAVFIGIFLFDILGDEVGVLQALWILLVMGTMPLWIWCGEYLYFIYKKKYLQQQDLPNEVQQ